MATDPHSHRGLVRFALRRAIGSACFVLFTSSAALLLVGIAPGDPLANLDTDPAAAAAERQRLGLDRPLAVQYGSWLWKAAQLDLGISLKYQRPVAQLVAERVANTLLLGMCGLILATVVGLSAGTVTGAGGRGAIASLARGASFVLLSIPPLVISIALLVAAAATGWLPVGGFPVAPGWTGPDLIDRIKYLILPTLALALPLAASLERLQSSAIRDALAQPSIQAARARGLSSARILWRHALRLSLTNVLSLYGIIIAGVLSGSFVVEVVMSWPGLGALMYEALTSRDLFLVAGCAVAASTLLALGSVGSDLALAATDPRLDHR